MLARVATFAIDGVEPRQVTVEVDIRPGLPAFTIVGLGDAAVRESRERIRSAILNSGFEFPQRRITANLAPASLRKAGPGFDAALALAVLGASEQVPAEPLTRVAVFGELSLGGGLRDAPGVLAVAEGTRRADIPRLIVPRERAREAALVEGLEVAGVDGLRDAVDAVTRRRLPPLPALPRETRPGPGSALARFATGAGVPAGSVVAAPELSDIRGHEIPLLALQIAAAGGHNLLMEGPPGTGKTMLARRLPSILPPLTRPQAIEVTRIHSVAGLHADGLIAERPFRAPHHTISAAGLVGGGSPPRPGEASLAHHGVLFLDELSEFQRIALDALRQPLEDGRVSIVRGQRALIFPTRFMLVAATNPCPCGYAGVGTLCSCADADLRRHQRRLSGPLLDRMDLLVTVVKPTEHELRGLPVTNSAKAQARVREARQRQERRLQGTGLSCNAQLAPGQLRRLVRLEERGQQVLARAYAAGALSARGRHRVLRVARTIADLAGRTNVRADDVLLALSLRQRMDADHLRAA